LLIFLKKKSIFPLFFVKIFTFFEKKSISCKWTPMLYSIFFTFLNKQNIKFGTNWEGGGPNWRNFFSSDTKFIDLKKKIFSECAINPCKQFFTEWLLVLPSLTLEKFLELFLNFRKPNFSSLKSYTE
jgi:hypothetical protein